MLQSEGAWVARDFKIWIRRTCSHPWQKPRAVFTSRESVVVVTTVFEYSRLYTEIAKRCMYNPKASYKKAQ
jgi:hypothetical protein